MWGHFSSFQICHSQLMKVLSQAVPLEDGSTSRQKEGRELHTAKKEQLHHYLIVLKKKNQCRFVIFLFLCPSYRLEAVLLVSSQSVPLTPAEVSLEKRHNLPQVQV